MLRPAQIFANACPSVPLAPLTRIGATSSAGASGRKPASVVTVVRGTIGLPMKRSARRHQPSPFSTGWLAALPAASSAISAASAVGRGAGARTSNGPGS